MLPYLLHTIDEKNYEQYLSQKISEVKTLFKEANLNIPSPEIYKSPAKHYRMRVEFAIFQEDNGIQYIMYEKGTKKIIFIDTFPGATQAINEAMPIVREVIPCFKILKEKLFEIDFLSNLLGELIISLHYHKKIDTEEFKNALQDFRKLLQSKNIKCNIVAHAKKQIIINETNILLETFKDQDINVKLLEQEGCFSQPNAFACTKMLSFATKCVANNKPNEDLLELYCGSGTFTITLAPYFRKVLATELCRDPVKNALKSMTLNNITNTKIVRLSAEEVTSALNKEREFRRLKEANINLEDYNFSTLLIDPPRAGLQSEAALKFTAKFNKVIYISCGPKSLVSDLQFLTKTHKIKKLAFFDQFPYTEHLESGVLLIKKGN